MDHLQGLGLGLADVTAHELAPDSDGALTDEPAAVVIASTSSPAVAVLSPGQAPAVLAPECQAPASAPSAQFGTRSAPG